MAVQQSKIYRCSTSSVAEYTTDVQMQHQQCNTTDVQAQHQQCSSQYTTDVQVALAVQQSIIQIYIGVAQQCSRVRYIGVALAVQQSILPMYRCSTSSVAEYSMYTTDRIGSTSSVAEYNTNIYRCSICSVAE